jgi:hypothetical protein
LNTTLIEVTHTHTHRTNLDITSTPCQKFLEKNLEQYLITCSPVIKNV